MKATRHPTNNAVLAAPDGWDEAADGECVDLPITQDHGCMFSYWRPTLRERFAILFGGHVRLAVVGKQHPPVALDTLS